MVSESVISILKALTSSKEHNNPLIVSRYLFIWSVAINDAYCIGKHGESKHLDPYFLPPIKTLNFSDKYRTKWSQDTSEWLSNYLVFIISGKQPTRVKRHIPFSSNKVEKEFTSWIERMKCYVEARTNDGSKKKPVLSNPYGVYDLDTNTGSRESWQPLRSNGEEQIPTGILWGQVACPLPEETIKALVSKTNKFFYPDMKIWEKELNDLVKITSDLSEHEKVLAEFWNGSPPPVIWAVFAYMILKGNRIEGELEVKTWLLISASLFTSSIVCWRIKYTNMLSRPIQAIRGRSFLASWTPYLETPPFPDFCSGHSMFSSSAAEILVTLLGNERTNLSSITTFFPNSLLRLISPLFRDLEDGYFTTRTIFVNPCTSLIESTVPSCGTRITLSTLTNLADEAGMSRIYGGIHVPCSNFAGLHAGGEIARCIYNFYSCF